ncbi:BAHD1 protein, partial [Polypterus senegalus]
MCPAKHCYGLGRYIGSILRKTGDFGPLSRIAHVVSPKGSNYRCVSLGVSSACGNSPRKHVMTHARRKSSLSRYPSESQDQVGSGPHAEPVDGAWPECPKEGMAKRGPSANSATEDGDRKSYSLRKRSGMTDVGTRRCHVVLTRLNSGDVERDQLKEQNVDYLQTDDLHEQNSGGESDKWRKMKLGGNFVSGAPPVLHLASEPRKRRLASLNAEAVNSLLLEREDFQKEPRFSRKGTQRLHKDCLSVKDSSGKPQIGSDDSFLSKKTKTLKSSSSRTEKEDLKGVDLEGPAPKRLAGLNAAALLKLTGASAGVKRRLKQDGKGEGICGKKRPKIRPPKNHHLQLKLLQDECLECKKEAFSLKTEWEGLSGQDNFPHSGYHCRSLLGYSMKPVKQEQTEAEVKPFFHCASEESVEYCHRLALLLRHQNFASQPFEETDDRTSPLKQEFLLPQHSLAHSALSVGTSPYLCMDPCYSSYYLHYDHQGTSSPPVTHGPVPYPTSAISPVPMCTAGVQSSKLLVSAATTPSGIPIPHPAFCNSMGSSCFGEACGMNGFTNNVAYRAMHSLATRGCTFNMGHTGCTHKVKTEAYSTSLDERNPSIPVSPTLPLSGCPVPTVPPAAQSVPHLQTPLSDPSQPQIQLKVARECPQSAKPPSGSRSGVRSTTGCPHLSRNELVSGHTAATGKQQRISRRRATNGWLPVGLPVEKEVFIVGADEPALRRCYEGVQRDGEIIRIRDTVLLRSGPRKKSLPYVAKISALWEDPKTGELMMSLFWYYRPEHTQGGRNPSMHCENEIFASRHQDENSVACIEDKCYVLTLSQYCRFCASVKRRGEGLPESANIVPPSPEYAIPVHRRVPGNIDPNLVFLCRHVYDFRYGRILKNLQ